MATAPDLELVLAANQAFYDAFENRDMDAMSDLWEHSDRVFCTHPGWRSLHGWGSVASSWFGLFGGPQRLQFIVTDARCEVVGDAAWVTCTENLLDGGPGGAVAALNVFARTERGWQMIGHHGSGVMTP